MAYRGLAILILMPLTGLAEVSPEQAEFRGVAIADHIVTFGRCNPLKNAARPSAARVRPMLRMMIRA